MLTHTVCADSGSSSWVAFASAFSFLLVQPLLIPAGLVILLGIGSLMPRHPMQQILRNGTIALGFIYLICFFPPTINIAETALKQAIPQDSRLLADAVVVLGRGEELNSSRAEVAAHLWQERRAPLIFASGIYDAPKLLSMLHNTGIPEQALQGEDCSRTTYENAEFTATLLKPQGIERILLVTDEPHMLRSFLTFRGFGFQVIPVSSVSSAVLDRSSRTKLVLREFMGLVSYSVLGRFSVHPDSSVSSVAQETTIRQTNFQQRKEPKAATGAA